MSGLGFLALAVFLALAAFALFKFGVGYAMHGSLQDEMEDLVLQRILKGESFPLRARMERRMERVAGTFDGKDLVIDVGPNGDAIRVNLRYHRAIDLKLLEYRLPMVINFTLEKSAAKASFDNVVDGLERSRQQTERRLQENLKKIK